MYADLAPRRGDESNLQLRLVCQRLINKRSRELHNNLDEEEVTQQHVSTACEREGSLGRHLEIPTWKPLGYREIGTKWK